MVNVLKASDKKKKLKRSQGKGMHCLQMCDNRMKA